MLNILEIRELLKKDLEEFLEKKELVDKINVEKGFLTIDSEVVNIRKENLKRSLIINEHKLYGSDSEYYIPEEHFDWLMNWIGIDYDIIQLDIYLSVFDKFELIKEILELWIIEEISWLDMRRYLIKLEKYYRNKIRMRKSRNGLKTRLEKKFLIKIK